MPDRKLSLYLTFKGELLLVGLIDLEKKEVLSWFTLPLIKIIPSLVRKVELELLDLDRSLSCLGSIYFNQRESRWNSNRLVATFVKTLAFSLPLKIYEGSREIDEERESDLFNLIKEFQEISWKDLKPLYNKCPITNT
ncbi:retrotransposon peptidase family protein [Candidatus Mycoplasma haematolamae str. Purdue]|uniref:Retrotransposon peptidase family protein n=1 Tax=Mycoplasma haematolamae (strain Purdue) TaxID=1212765 RepID=I7BII9_MYCHA|nr:hypothetical protein [Candidatus Mycoplasma haematolamae]AFO51638.1 retrotransposon peptidase family protein [Candidatus Mycoplasma haematolamae str. Purdue]